MGALPLRPSGASAMRFAEGAWRAQRENAQRAWAENMILPLELPSFI